MYIREPVVPVGASPMHPLGAWQCPSAKLVVCKYLPMTGPRKGRYNGSSSTAMRPIATGKSSTPPGGGARSFALTAKPSSFHS